MASNEPPSQSRWVELFSPAKYTILGVLSSYLTIADFLVLCQVCKGLDGLRACMLGKVSNVNARLRHFVNDPPMFRSQLGNHGAVISGCFALNLLELGRFEVLHLDILVRDGANADNLTNYMRENEQYQSDDPDVETRGGIYSNSARPGRKLRITRTSGSPIRYILTSSYTTACVNFITWNKAFSIFPQQTLINHQFYPLRSLDDDFGSKLKDLASQGWTTRDITWPDFASVKPGNLAGLRRVGGSSTLVIQLDTDSVHAPSTPDFVIEHAQFEISEESFHPHNRAQPVGFGRTGFQIVSPQIPFLKIRADEMTSPALRHAYTTASMGWRKAVDVRLLRWAWLELYKLEPGNRPNQSMDASPLVSDVSIPQAFEKPQSWDYADDQIPGWYQELGQMP